ncbi:phosphate acetyltransferase [Gordonia sp. (in: high G+C Gram-positive bacteria)]|jgi:phosphate acetyltransferase|uniref:phosphate acetyltransferase n=1 Tax=Gordonia sp. (in: high G+C Gram-positive bacteria) TaxID=84139 RepID=UPI001D6ECFEF|nr:phosphate acetyltransferase [Gordonia sp. (in: high G+C Gram-positive bacteria)]MCB1295917.1 phosphate acetyltransferase [Gordonia sp. (in: high G+C Gram-positive bacteria)]HMS76165.1 phosphate acetyltransferase [Gordonia sp. (in: high G+C Gram-positive bacteria)]HQV17102.1 phosphate acetyltransferase [Gordonia sp. (in: high G+C Gram-positive bacteria)]
MGQSATPESAPSCRNIYVASAEGDTGKSAIALGLLALLIATSGRVGVFRPISRAAANGERDRILELMMEHLSADLDYDDCLGVTYDDVHADPDAAIAEIVARFHAVEERCDAVVIVGSDYTGIGNPSELSFNARVAANLSAPVVLALRAVDQTPAELRAHAEVLVGEIAAAHASTAVLIANRCDPARLKEITAELATTGVQSWALPEDPILVAPTMGELQAALGAELYSGDPELLDREALRVMVGGMTVEHILERITDSTVVITPADRSDVLLALVNANVAHGFPRLTGIILNGGLRPHPMIDSLVKGMRATLPIIACEQGTYETARTSAHTRGQVSRFSARKIEAAIAMMEKHIDAAELMKPLDVPLTEVVTPQMFEYELLARARADRRHIVLPEGNDDRILRAAGILVRRNVARLTVLGDPVLVRARADELGIDFDGIDIINPLDSELVDEFADAYHQLRKHKGIDEEAARDIVRDVSYFGTMMVHLGKADGMVSGAAHTTAHTIRPSFEIIKTKPGVSTVSSVFFMCLADQVLAFGDCAVVPDPTDRQLADIAISSSETAAAFGITPRVAMLSYSTGQSGSGADVDKVRVATGLVRERRPDLLVEGPIQYDAAVEPSVAATKMPDSPVAGQATVLIFPDLNTGNNTYKAVQRSAGAVAIGPVLQGLNKPINDLSRGALVSDIVNTVAITAIQAQACEKGDAT